MFFKNENIFAEYKKLKESTKEYAKSLEKIANDKKLKNISRKDRETLAKIADLLKLHKEENSLEESVLTEDKTPVIAEMKVLLATAYTLAVKSQNYHWNVTGPNFVEYHNFLGEYYNFLNDNIDIIAEQIRTMDARSPGSLAEFLESSRVNEETGTPNALQMLGNLAEDNQTLADVVLEVIPIAEANSVTGLVNYLEDFVDKLYKQNWFLKSIQGTSLQESVELEEAGYMDADGKDYKQFAKDVKNKDSRDLQAVKEAIKEMKIKKLDKDTLDMLRSLDDDEARMVIQGLPTSLRRKAMKELGLKEKVDGRTKGYKETVSRLMAKKEQVKEEQDPLLADENPVTENGQDAGLQEEVSEAQQKSFTVNLQNLNGPNTKKVMDILLNHEVQDNIVYTGDTDKGLTFKVKDEDGIRGLGLQLKKFKIDVAMQEADVKDEEEKKEEKVNEEALEERRAFIFAAAKAKANGEKKFIFNGKEFKVKLKNGPTVEADVKDEEEDLEVVKEKK